MENIRSGPASPSSATRVRLLVIDDNADDAFMLGRTLKKAGLAWELVHASGEEALRAAEKNEFDLVLVGFYLRGLRLAEVVEALRVRRSGCPVVLFSGADPASVKTACQELAIEWCASKDDLSGAVEILCRVVERQASGRR